MQVASRVAKLSVPQVWDLNYLICLKISYKWYFEGQKVLRSTDLHFGELSKDTLE